MATRLRVDPDRPLESYGRLGWVTRTVARNLEWARSEGVRRLIEEHDLDPAQRLARVMRRTAWRATRSAGPARPAGAVFVAGVGRSGTNMLMRALAESPEVDVYNEGSRRAFVRYRLRDDEVIWRLVDRSVRRAVAIKPLLDGHRVAGFLSARPASACALWLFRDVDAVVRSHVRKFGSQPRNALHRIAEGAGDDMWQAQGMNDDDRRLLRSFDWPSTSAEDGAALLWLLRNRLYFRQLEHRPRVRIVRYESLVDDPSATLRDLVEFAGLSWYPFMASRIDRRAFSQPVRTALSPAVRERCDEMTDDLLRTYRAQQ